MTAATKIAFERMAEVGGGDAGALALGLRRGVTSVGLRALSARMLHAAAAAPERMADILDNAAAGWLAGPIFPPRLRVEEPLPIPAPFWTTFWDLVNLSPAQPPETSAALMLRLAGEMDPRVHRRVAAVAGELPGIRDAAAGGIPEPFDLEALAACHTASLGFLLRDDIGRAGGWPEAPRGLAAQLRRMPPPLDYINLQLLQSMPVLSLVAGYSRAALDQVAFGGFLMAQVAHHYSALGSAVLVAVLGERRPPGLELTLDSIFKGWVHGRETPPLIGVPWPQLWGLRIDQVRAALRVAPFESPYVAAVRKLSRPTSGI